MPEGSGAGCDGAEGAYASSAGRKKGHGRSFHPSVVKCPERAAVQNICSRAVLPGGKWSSTKEQSRSDPAKSADKGCEMLRLRVLSTLRALGSPWTGSIDRFRQPPAGVSLVLFLPSTQEGRALVVPATCPGKQEHLTV